MINVAGKIMLIQKSRNEEMIMLDAVNMPVLHASNVRCNELNSLLV